jgi:hypothetical protein
VKVLTVPNSKKRKPNDGSSDAGTARNQDMDVQAVFGEEDFGGHVYDIDIPDREMGSGELFGFCKFIFDLSIIVFSFRWR